MVAVPIITTLKHPMGRVAYVNTCLGSGFGASGGTATLNGSAVTLTKQTDDTLIWPVPSIARGSNLPFIFCNSGGLCDTILFRVLVPSFTIINP